MQSPNNTLYLANQVNAPSKWDSTLIGIFFCVATAALCMVFEPECRHWFIIPILFCAALISGDAIDWLTGRCGLLDPRGVLGCYGLYFFFLAPILHVLTDWWMPYITPIDDWRPWLGVTAILNCIGLLIYRMVSQRAREYRPRTHRVWILQEQRFWVLLIFISAISLVAEIYIYVKLGGVAGEVDTYMQSLTTHQDPLAGMGWLLVVGESFPALMMLGLIVLLRRNRKPPKVLALACMLMVFMGVQLMFGGFRGSRANTVWSVVWAIGALHMTVRPLSRRFIFAGGLVLVAFTYIAGFYKEAGASALDAFQGAESFSVMSQKTHRTTAGMILGDFGRADVQAYAVYRMLNFPAENRLAWGQTYLGDACLMIPQALWPDRLPGKSKWTAELEYGIGAAEYQRSSRIFGLLGEATLNFGPWLAPFSFALLALLVTRVQKWMREIDRQDCRIMLLPFAVLLCIQVLVFDLDNLIWIVVKFAAIPTMILALSSVRLVRKEARNN
jgi:hypothetical protein